MDIMIDTHAHILSQKRLEGLSIWLGQVFRNHPLAGKHFAENQHRYF